MRSSMVTYAPPGVMLSAVTPLQHSCIQTYVGLRLGGLIFVHHTQC